MDLQAGVGVAQALRHCQASARGAVAYHHHEHIGHHTRRRDAQFLHEQHNTLFAERPPDGRGGLAAEQGNEAVVPPARTHRVLGAQRIRDPFEHGTGVVVEAAY